MQPLTWFVQIATCLKHVTRCKCQHTHNSTVENNERCLMNAYANYRFLIHLHKARKQPRRERERAGGRRRVAANLQDKHKILQVFIKMCRLPLDALLATHTIQTLAILPSSGQRRVDDNDDDVWRKTANHQIGKSLFNYMMILVRVKLSRFSFHPNYII